MLGQLTVNDLPLTLINAYYLTATGMTLNNLCLAHAGTSDNEHSMPPTVFSAATSTSQQGIAMDVKQQDSDQEQACEEARENHTMQPDWPTQGTLKQSGMKVRIGRTHGPVDRVY